MLVNIYTDSSVKGFKGSGKLVYVLEAVRDNGETAKTESGCDTLEDISKNRAELLVIVEALRRLKDPKAEVNIHTDSQYFINSMPLLRKWSKNGWRRAKGRYVANHDLWTEYFQLTKTRKTLISPMSEHSYRKWLSWEAHK